jgi:hemoglobin-like flavoprotein
MKFFAVLALCIVGACAAPLTADEAQLVKDSWHKVNHNEIEILANFFTQHPEHQARFPAFVGKDLAALKDTAKFATHATRIISALSEVIELSGNPAAAPALKTVLHTLGSEHKRRGIPKESFADFQTSFISYIKGQVSWGDNVEAAWNDAFENAFTVFFESY